MKVELKRYTDKPEELIEEAYRICYGGTAKYGEEGRHFISSKVKLGHTSPLEHATATFLISGVSRALTHQLVRHRIASYTQRSQRYCNESQFEYVVPTTIESDENMSKDFKHDMETIQGMYDKWVKLGVKREDARFVLPNACTTTIMVSMNFAEYRHVISLRSDSHAQWEIRQLSNEILQNLYKIAPSVFVDLYEKYIGTPLKETFL